MGICLKFSAKPKFLKSYEPLEFLREKIMLSSRTQQKQTNRALFPKFWNWAMDPRQISHPPKYRNIKT